MAFININVSPDFKITNKLLGRIAFVLEQIAKEHFGLTLKEAPLPDEKDKGGVMYTSDVEELRKEVVKAMEIEEEGQEQHA